jgi:signal transduction histidine kinase
VRNGTWRLLCPESGTATAGVLKHDASALYPDPFDAMREKLTAGEGGPQSGSYAPKLTIRSRRNAQRIAVEIEDNGPGIPDAIRDKVLQPFFTTKRGTQGTGLGLSITHDIVKAHRGDLNIKTNGSSGATFIIGLPAETQK